MSCEVAKKIGTGDCENNHCKAEQNFANIVASELVQEILENALEIVEDYQGKQSQEIAGDIVENLASKFQKMNLTEEIKDDKVSEKDETRLAMKGLGDQLNEIATEETSLRHPPVEKKNRLTDLVKNSKQLLAKFILNEKEDKFESKHEKLVRVVDLDVGDQPYKVKDTVLPENIPLPRSDSCEILEQTDGEESSMDDIQLSQPEAKRGTNNEEIYKKTMTFPLSSSSGKNLSFAARCRTLKFPSELKKKKWNIGSKIISYIRKHQPRKDGKEKTTTNGVEFKPDADN